ncbi:hypothetical protein EJ04DRAFT_609545 [Polyplosphaeria fusca]|uniref:Uncharacterized protein n=1 Tax=Polyplosphaeria fusca TaxID=682080 RepID=A0A9P4V0C3_9PLEO|nr:hypothetical protein EJ04DRAFT_609545 [Polyplosphaeria fusca]
MRALPVVTMALTLASTTTAVGIIGTTNGVVQVDVGPMTIGIAIPSGQSAYPGSIGIIGTTNGFVQLDIGGLTIDIPVPGDQTAAPSTPATPTLSMAPTSESAPITTTQDVSAPSTTPSIPSAPFPTPASNATDTDDPSPSMASTPLPVPTPLQNPNAPSLISYILTNHTHRIFSNSAIRTAKLTRYCALTSTTSDLCDTLSSTVSTCIDADDDDASDNCEEQNMRDLLANALDTDLCSGYNVSGPVYELCARWYTAAARCNAKIKRGPCAIGHVGYLLRGLRDLIGLKGGGDVRGAVVASAVSLTAGGAVQTAGLGWNATTVGLRY